MYMYVSGGRWEWPAMRAEVLWRACAHRHIRPLTRTRLLRAVSFFWSQQKWLNFIICGGVSRTQKLSPELLVSFMKTHTLFTGQCVSQFVHRWTYLVTSRERLDKSCVTFYVGTRMTHLCIHVQYHNINATGVKSKRTRKAVYRGKGRSAVYW